MDIRYSKPTDLDSTGKNIRPMTAPLSGLYSFRRCPYAMRARLGLLFAQLQVELREIVLRNKPAQMLAISPKGTVPVL